MAVSHAEFQTMSGPTTSSAENQSPLVFVLREGGTRTPFYFISAGADEPLHLEAVRDDLPRIHGRDGTRTASRPDRLPGAGLAAPPQDLSTWRTALRTLLTDAASYRQKAEAGREAAYRFLAETDVRHFVGYLAALKD